MSEVSFIVTLHYAVFSWIFSSTEYETQRYPTGTTTSALYKDAEIIRLGFRRTLVSAVQITYRYEVVLHYQKLIS